MLVRRVATAALFFIGLSANAAEDFWYSSQQKDLATPTTAHISAKGYRLSLNHKGLSEWSQSHASMELMVPMPDGAMRAFRLTPNATLAAELTAKYPSMRTFSGVDISDPANKGSFEITSQGFSGFFYYQGERVLLSPQLVGNNQQHISHYRKDAGIPEGLREELHSHVHETGATIRQGSRVPLTNSSVRRYRLAMAANSRFASEVGNSNVTDTMAVITTLVNRINEIFRSEVGVEFQLISNNDELVFADPTTDPFVGIETELDEFTSIFNDRIGSANFDIGHLLNVQSGGFASNGLCTNTFKMQAYTGLIPGTSANESFVVDLLAHEMGHQFSASHSFNGLVANCGLNDQRQAQTAWEPGSGSTIMGYASICGSQNLQNFSDAFFHVGSILEMREDIEGPFTFASRCGTDVAVSNQVPTVDAGSNFTIPANTPFSLTGSGEDADGDTLTYIWEQLDPGGISGGTNSVSEMVDDGNRPLFRSFTPTASPVRFLPRYAAVLDGSADEGNNADNPNIPSSRVSGETYPTTDRTLNFQLTARDGNGGVASDAMVVNVVDTGARFAITSPGAGDTLTAQNNITVLWDVAGTDAAPINCSTVDIGVSYDDGAVFNVQLNDTPNDGEASFTLPTNVSNDARLLITCSDNIFYAVSAQKFIVEGPNQAPVAVNDAAEVEQDSAAVLIDVLANDSDDRDTNLTLSDFTYDGDGTVTIVNNQIQYQPGAGFTGEDSLSYQVQDSDGLTSTGTLTITVAEAPEPPPPAPTPTPQPAPSGGGGGGAPWLFLGLVAIALLRRVTWRPALRS